MNNTDDKIKELLAGTKLKASGNLKYRIMQQIETEKVLSRQQEKKDSSIWSNFSILGGMYAAIIIVCGIIYMFVGPEVLQNTNLLIMPAVFIAAIGSMFFLISTFDDRRQSKKQSKR